LWIEGKLDLREELKKSNRRSLDLKEAREEGRSRFSSFQELMPLPL
jgi:hypothetical protein